VTFTRLLSCLLLFGLCLAPARAETTATGRPRNELHAAPIPVVAPAGAAVLGAHGRTLIAVTGNTAQLLAFPAVSTPWTDTPAAAILAHTSAAEGFFLISADRVLRLTAADNTLSTTLLPALPSPATVATAAVLAGKLHVATDSGFYALDLKADVPAWSALPASPVPVAAGSVLVAQLEQLTLFTPGSTRVYLPFTGWKPAPRAPAPFDFTAAPSARFGAAHVFFFAPDTVHSYHVATDTWTTYSTPVSAPLSVVATGETVAALSADASVSSVSVLPLPTGYNWLDHSFVAAYLLAMVGMSVWFARRKQDSNDYFRGGNRIPWWVSGMSLFATFASAISLMAMPGKSFAGDWTYFSQGLFALLVLPVSLFVLAPFVRRLKIPTANAYLERRFGLTTRLIGSTIGVFTTSIARQGSVLVLPSIALSTVMGVPIEACILVMGLVTLGYTFFGGLSAVVWTDTVQGFIMIGAVVGCLLLAWSRVDLTSAEAWSLLQSSDKLVTFDWNWSLAYPTAWIFLITTVIGTLGGVSSQDYIQRVQCTPDLKQAQLAVATQLLVAVPLNLLLFGLGTVLYLFYQQNPADLSPAMKLDGIYPFFVAQQLPPGVSGLVVAALLAATMSTISSCNCSVSDIVTQDFYKRFHPAAPDRTILLFGRGTTLASGLLGIGTALWMANATMGSIWDLATLVTNLIGNGIVGLFTLGLLTRRAHQTGALIGVLSGMGVVFWLQQSGGVTFWLYSTVGTVVTVSVGYFASLILPGRIPALAGLTVFTLKEKPSA
jgi:SSS family transporter